METRERYKIIKRLGTGGCGAVYKAFDTVLQRSVAIKCIKKDEGDTLAKQQLLAEAKTLASVKHPQIVSIYDIYSTSDEDKIIMELVQGVNFSQLVKKHLLQACDFKIIALQLLDGINTAHNAGIVHRDLKPENLMLRLNEDGVYEVKILDFGMSTQEDAQSLEKTNTLTGSIHMMAPELFEGNPATIQSDLYALGCVFYYILTGCLPFEGDNTVQVMAMHISGNYKPLQEIRTDLPEELCEWVQSLIQLSPTDRASSCREVAETLAPITIEQQQRTFNLPTKFADLSSNSLVVRAIDKQSLVPRKPGATTKVVLANSSAFQDTTSRNLTLTAPQNVKAEDLPPAGAEWFFNVNETIKGPISLEKLRTLCAEGKVRKNSLVWHPHFGEWIKASACSETKEHVLAKPPLAMSATMRHSCRVTVSQPVAQKNVIERLAGFFKQTDALLAILGILIAAASFYFMPDRHTAIWMTLAIALLIVGMIRARLHQAKSGKYWLTACIILPILGDLLHALAKPSRRSIFGALLVTSTTAYLGYTTIYAKTNSSPLATQEATSEHQSTPLVIAHSQEEEDQSQAN